MQIKIERPLFEWLKTNAWGGAKEIIHYFTIEEIDTLENIMEDYTEEWTEIGINDLFWFDKEVILNWLEIDEEEFDRRQKQW